MLEGCTRLGDTVLSHVWLYNAQTVLKRIEGCSLAEAEAMRLVRERTSIPVPKILKSFYQSDYDASFIFMEYIPGEPLDLAWESCTASQRQNIVSQLKTMMQELRSISGNFIGTVPHGACNDQIFGNAVHQYGPYDDETAFCAGIALSLRACDAHPAFTEKVVTLVEALPRHNRIVFTHGDLVPRNILVRDGNVVGIVDWEMAGYYPEYWEYAKAHFFADYDHPWMEEKVLDQILEPYPVELGLLLHTRKIFAY
ncbi:kinase-like protein [Nemania sp. FL0916]|nr:kinase-like protein [Nemania sp. FL0916]